MNNDFKKAGYFSAIAIFIIGVAALVISTAASYFAYDAAIILVGQFVSLIAFLGLLIIGVVSKHKYNSACVRFAEYILNNRKKEAERDAFDAERAKEIQNMQTAAAQERENAVAAALEQGRSEGAAQVKAAQPAQVPPQYAPRMVPAPVEPYPAYVQQISPSDEVLYNEYGEPVMIRRRVKKQRAAKNADMQYDRFGKPVANTPAPEAPSPAKRGYADDKHYANTPVLETPSPAPMPAPVSAPVNVPTAAENQIYKPAQPNMDSIYAADASNNQIYSPEPPKNPVVDESSTPRPINVDPYRIDL